MITFLFIPGAETSLEEAASAVALQQRSEQPTAQPLQVGDGKSNFFFSRTSKESKFDYVKPCKVGRLIALAAILLYPCWLQSDL